MKKPRLTICGVMSGSSLDGLDMAICEFNQSHNDSIEWNIQKALTVEFSNQLAIDILECYNSSSSFIYNVEQRFSQFSAKAICEFIEDENVDYIGFHGHTIFHEPQNGYTIQIGNGHYLTQHLGIPVIAQFRNKDVALGGQGAPLAPTVEKYLMTDNSIFLNLGGIANISIHNANNITAFDITACNQALNHLSAHFDKKYDDNGDIAASGKVDHSLLKKLNQLEFLNQKPPKSLSNTWVQNEFISILDNQHCDTKDKMYTTVIHIAQQIAKCFDLEMKGETILASGGGVHNGFMMSQIAKELESKNIFLKKPSDEISEFKESLLMALMAYLRINEMPNCFASVTGASRDSSNGIIYHPEL